MTEEVGLSRRLSLPLLTLYGLGTILGAGIYVLVGKVAGQAGLYAPLSFLLAAIIAGLTGYSYARLSSRYPVSAGPARYVRQAFKSKHLSGIIGWSIVMIGVTTAATMSKGFAGYLQVFIPLDEWLVISLLIVLFGGLTIWGILESVSIAAVITVIEIAGLLFVIGMNLPAFSNAPELIRHWDELGSSLVWNGIILGSILAFYAFLGFEDIANVAEEAISPKRNLPRAIFLSLGISCLLYLLVSLLSVLLLPLELLTASEAPMVDMLSEDAWSRNTIGLISMLAISNGALIQIIMASRIIYGMSVQQNAPAIYSFVNRRTRTPVYSILVVCLLALVFAFWLPLVTLAQLTSVITLFVFGIVNLSLLKDNLNLKKTFSLKKAECLIPILGAFSCLFLLLYQLILGF